MNSTHHRFTRPADHVCHKERRSGNMEKPGFIKSSTPPERSIMNRYHEPKPSWGCEETRKHGTLAWRVDVRCERRGPGAGTEGAGTEAGLAAEWWWVGRLSGKSKARRMRRGKDWKNVIFPNWHPMKFDLIQCREIFPYALSWYFSPKLSKVVFSVLLLC
jgi:hypothetical protein